MLRFKGGIAFICCLFLASCATLDQDSQTLSPCRPTGKPYTIKGVWYYPQPYYEFDETGVASYYGGSDGCHGLPTATGERFDMYELTAAHKTLPLPCVVLVINLENGRMLKLKVNDRGPFKNNRILDVSARAAKLLGFRKKGTAMVRVVTLVDESVNLPENLRAFAKQGMQKPQTFAMRQLPKSQEPEKPKTLAPGITCPPPVLSSISLDSLIHKAVKLAQDPALETKGKKARVGHPHLYIQVQSHAKLADAKRQVQKLAKLGDLHIQKQLTDHGNIYKVILGPVAHVRKADQLLDKLIEKGCLQSHIVIE